MDAKRYAITAAAIIVLAIAIIYAELPYAGMRQAAMPKAFAVHNMTYNITAYAYTAQQSENGLMNATVTNYTFMLFYFNRTAVYPFWMKNTYSQLDIIWLDYNRSTNMAHVVYIANATPCIDYSISQSNCAIYTPSSSANYVLEAKDGFVQRNNIKVGTVFRFK